MKDQLDRRDDEKKVLREARSVVGRRSVWVCWWRCLPGFVRGEFLMFFFVQICILKNRVLFLLGGGGLVCRW